MKFSKHDLRMFEAARKKAEKSDFGRFKVGCVIAYKGHIIGRGANSTKSHPLQKQYNRRYRKFNATDGQAVNHALHAEISAIVNVPYVTGKDVDWSKAKIYVYRICTGKKIGHGNARPCDACMQAIHDVGIRNVYYSDDNGLAYLRLD